MVKQIVGALLSEAYIPVQKTDINQENKWSNRSFQAGKHTVKKSKQGNVKVTSTQNLKLKSESPLSPSEPARQLCRPFLGLMRVNGLECLIGYALRVACPCSGRSGLTSRPVIIIGRRQGLVLGRKVQSMQKSDSKACWDPGSQLCLLGVSKQWLRGCYWHSTKLAAQPALIASLTWRVHTSLWRWKLLPSVLLVLKSTETRWRTLCGFCEGEYTVSPLHTNLQVVNFQQCEHAFACPVLQVSSSVWRLLLHVCILYKRLCFSVLNSTVYSTVQQKIFRRGSKNTQNNCTEKVSTTQIITMVWPLT